MIRVLFRMLLGFLAGFVAWGFVEPTAPAGVFEATWRQFESRLLIAFGIATGIAICVYNAYVMGGRVRMLLAFMVGPALGVLGVLMGYGLGANLVDMLFHQSIQQMQNMGQHVPAYLARIVALTPVGTLLGLAIGVTSLDKRRALHGAIGGTIGGAIGGMLFDPIAILFASPTIVLRGASQSAAEEVGGLSRAVYFIVLGGMIALFIGIVEQIARQASLRLALGRNEGRDYPLFGARTLIGRHELAQVPIFNDPAVAPLHAYVDRRGPVYWLLDGGSGAPTFLNGQPVSAAPLDHGAHIQVGNTILQFLLKSLPRSMAPAGYTMAPVGAAATGLAPDQSNVPYSQSTLVQPQRAVRALVATDGPMVGQRFPLSGLLEIGREATGVSVRFDSSASRRHASITPGPAGLILQDLGSTNGTFLNGQKVTNATIEPGDLVKIGATTFRVE
jgi:pSer/pThr/pTyr-binding forkhead associated (FHA) protein